MVLWSADSNKFSQFTYQHFHGVPAWDFFIHITENAIISAV